MRTAGMKEELLALEARKSKFAAEVRQAPPAARLHPRLANIYGDKVERLRESIRRCAGSPGTAIEPCLNRSRRPAVEFVERRSDDHATRMLARSGPETMTHRYC